MKDKELIDSLKQQAKEIADVNIAGWGNTMLDAANRLEQLVSFAEPNEQLFTIAEVRELLAKQRVICNVTYFSKEQNCKTYGQIIQLIEDAPEPKFR